jgi:hypothetical protein
MITYIGTRNVEQQIIMPY